MDKESGQRRLFLGQAGVGTQGGAAHSNSDSSLLWGKKRHPASLNIDSALEKGLSLLLSGPSSSWFTRSMYRPGQRGTRECCQSV